MNYCQFPSKWRNIKCEGTANLSAHIQFISVRLFTLFNSTLLDKNWTGWSPFSAELLNSWIEFHNSLNFTDFELNQTDTIVFFEAALQQNWILIASLISTFLFINGKLLWNNRYCIEHSINKGNLAWPIHSILKFYWYRAVINVDVPPLTEFYFHINEGIKKFAAQNCDVNLEWQVTLFWIWFRLKLHYDTSDLYLI